MDCSPVRLSPNLRFLSPSPAPGRQEISPRNGHGFHMLEFRLRIIWYYISQVNPIPNTQVKPTTWSAHCEEKEKHSGYGVYGRARTLNFKEFTHKTLDILTKYNDSIPGPGSLFSMQFHRDPVEPLESVFSPRCGLYWLEIIATARDEAAAAVADQWALALKKELLEKDPENIFDSAYIGFLDDGEADLNMVFGDAYEKLRAVKQKVDPKNVFKNTIPRL
ncbi:hypothetical protein IL306_013272 [Fusarium sp. DS 682]|nr:hypothetical protein IL306_013272 [Fusarium sp. DS 682]